MFKRERFRKMFPNLSDELEFQEDKIAMNSVRSDFQTGENAASERFSHYMPDVIDFIRRCDNKEQAEEIVAYMEKRGEIGKEYAEKLRRQLADKGVRSFGPKKEQDFYLKRSQR